MTEQAMLLQAERIGFGYGRDLLFRDLSFEAHTGEILAVLGPNGSGKTTLLKCLMGYLKLREGTVRIFGQDLRTLSEKALFETIAYVPQHRELPVSYTVLETVLIGLTGRMGVFSQPGRAEVERGEEVLERLGIAALRNRVLGELSGGEVQMVLLARALVKNPKMLILDEPESGLDFKNQLVVLDAIHEAKEQGIACIFNTHYPEHAFRYADRGLLFCPGENGGPNRVLNGPIPELITEKNIKTSFGVEALIGTIEADDIAIKSVVPIKLSHDKEER
ncbi:MAG: ABC transporter ATP-binding protein [Lachnospiraceae bacterium]|nr:ABC transporter ATP-binding protein [Lachnospiraceae bacterium]